MAIQVQHGPSMIDYGQAIALASEQATANDRAATYANYLAGIQRANQDYGLGLGKLSLDVKTQSDDLGIKQRQLSQDDFRNMLARDQLGLQRDVANQQNTINMLGATADIYSAYGNIARAMR